MVFQRRRLAVPELEMLPTTTTNIARGETHLVVSPTSTIFPYNTGLNGVNQPVNFLFTDMLWWSLGILALAVLAIRLIELAWAQLRLVSAMSVDGPKQSYWKLTQWSWMPGMKKNLLYAPLWNKRHNREIRLSSAINVGTLPSRFHAIILLGYLASNLAYMFILNWGNQNKYELCAELRGRSGTLALVNMVPLIILAGRNNPLIPILQVSFDTYNLLHRWMGRVVVLEVLVHLVAWAIVQVAAGGWDSVKHKAIHDVFISSGTIGSLALTLILILSVSPLRHAFYETFLNSHILLAFVAFVGTLVHCVSASVPGGLPQVPWITAILGLWLAERAARMLRLVYGNCAKNGYTEAIVEAMPNEATRVTMHLPRYVDVKPGQHAYLRFAGISPWENHPFSIAWFEHKYKEILPTNDKDAKKIQKPIATTVSFVIGAQTGFTRKLYNKAREQGVRAITVRAALEGPYAGHHSLDSYGHCVLFAGATGITHQISYLRHMVDGFNNGTVATRRVTLIWIVREFTVLEWARPWMDKILRMPNRKQIVRIKVFITRPKIPNQMSSSSETVHMYPGRPNIPMLLRKEVEQQMGAMCVTVCGPGGLADDVRDAVRKVQDHRQVIDFIEESFTW
ncbi:putative FAD binding protein [Lasiosphaeria hispida]|uniref:ferric-chelate reductase (NADPH) n=1 Tax=Lasiosphaeria hispida TaxID=260671 RepID=A0AAJ0HVL5_9PEZI|nr:putative FAD binding protein [Lasiosphaeria hispida]